MDVAICVITCQRPDGLKLLLSAIGELTFIKCQKPALHVIVVDNDQNGSAEVVCKRFEIDGRAVRYHVEPRRGIPFARNKCIEVSKDFSDFTAFIDDDEVPAPHWLDELLFVQERYNAGIVSGPVNFLFKSPPPAWIVKGNFFDLPKFKTGHCPVMFPATNNVLMASKIFLDCPVRFDERMVFTGGSDTNFFMRLFISGYSATWADDAIVDEWVPNSRVNLRWILMRSYRLGTSIVLSEKYAYSPYPLSLIVIRILKAFRRIILGSVSLPLLMVFGRYRSVQNLQTIFRGVGMLVSLAGISYDEYKTIHKS